MATKDKPQYATVAPVIPKGKYLVCTKRAGTKDRLAPIAECRSEASADTIVDALNHMHGELVKLEAPAQKRLEEVRQQLTREKTRADDLSRRARDRDDLSRQVVQKNQEIETLRKQVSNLQAKLEGVSA